MLHQLFSNNVKKTMSGHPALLAMRDLGVFAFYGCSAYLFQCVRCSGVVGVLVYSSGLCVHPKRLLREALGESIVLNSAKKLQAGTVGNFKNK